MSFGRHGIAERVDGVRTEIFHRTLYSLVAVVAMVASIMMSAFALTTGAVTKFTDVKNGDWYYEAVSFCVNKGMVNGTSDTTFSPTMTMDRSQFITILSRMDGTVEGDLFPASDCTDVPDGTWYTTYINWAKANGVV